jgi:hypothetical protein
MESTFSRKVKIWARDVERALGPGLVPVAPDVHVVHEQLPLLQGAHVEKGVTLETGGRTAV